jgi:hypothetical protein
MRIERKLTIDQLAERLALPRTTIYYWVRDLPIPGSGAGGGWPASAQRKGNRAMQRKYRLLREQAYAEGLAGFEDLSADPTFRDFVCMYIGEGSKRDRNRVSLGNSDPAVVRLATRWIRALSRATPSFSLQYHADQDLAELRRFWGRTVDVSESSIRMQRKSNSNRLTGRSWRSPYGVLSVTADDTLLRARLEAWMDLVRGTWL